MIVLGLSRFASRAKRLIGTPNDLVISTGENEYEHGLVGLVALLHPASTDPQ